MVPEGRQHLLSGRNHASAHAQHGVEGVLSHAAVHMAIGRHWDLVDTVGSTVALQLVRCQLTDIVNTQGEVVDAAGFAHGVDKHLNCQLEYVRLLAEVEDPRLARVIIEGK